MNVKLKCIQSEGELIPFFSVGKLYAAVIECNGIIRCNEDDQKSVEADGLSWCFWRMPNSLVIAYQHEQIELNTLFEVI